MKHFKVWLGYDKFVSISESELTKALAAQITGGVVVLSNGSIRGTSITLIEPDYHKAMGWNEGYKLQSEDWQEIKSRCGDYRDSIGEKRAEVKQLLSEGRIELQSGDLKQLQ